MKRRKMKNNTLLVVLFCLLLSCSCVGQKERDFMVMFYNVENLFDTVDNPRVNDDDFLPQSPRKWNSYRYKKKLQGIAQVMALAGGWQLPDVVGFCEVENDTCLRDLIQKTELYRFQYDFIHHESLDTRGIDVALIYNKTTFKPLRDSIIRPVFADSTRKTRDILYVEGCMLSTNDTVHIFICHFPSRRGGKDESEQYRVAVARQLRTVVDEILAKDSTANIVITGDFNDYPNEKSITKGLKARRSVETCPHCLVNLQDANADGTYKYKGYWNFLDQGIVSQGFLQDYEIDYRVVQNEGLLERNEKTGEATPYRTYQGEMYHGGYSDHLPITISFKKR